MSKRYRLQAVMKAIESWQQSEWFIASEILSRTNALSSQPRGGITVYSIARHLKTLEGRGLIESGELDKGRRQYRKL